MLARWQNHVPSYRRYAPKNLAVVRLNGKDVYLGAYGSPESHQKYDRLIAEWLATGRQKAAEPRNGRAPPLSINEMLLRYLSHAAAYYARDGKPGREYVDMTYAIRPVKDLYGMKPATSFGPLALKAVRAHLLQQDLCRREINKRVNRIRRVFKWAASEELIPTAVFDALRTVDGLRYGRSAARETEPVRPVELCHVDAVLPYVSPQVRAMIELQKLTGMRPGEVVRMRLEEIDRSTEVWQYCPTQHKTKHRGFERQVPLGPRAQQVLRPFLNRAPAAFLFSPREAEDWRSQQRHMNRSKTRKTKVFPCELRARERRRALASKRSSKRPKQDHYDVDSYRRAIEYGIAKARRHGAEVSHWHPHQLRHSYATLVREKFGIEGAQVGLGHAHVSVTEVYAEKSFQLATKIAVELG